MHPFPHIYSVGATAGASDLVRLSGDGLPEIQSAAPAEFDGPGDQWSPETLLLAAVADCFVLSFRAVAAASRFEWLSLNCTTEGTLDRVEKVTRFTEITNRVTLKLTAGASESQAERLLQKAEQVCLISNSLTAEVRLEIALESD